MTQIIGIYCGRCHRRYVYNACKNGLPCEHHFGEIVKWFEHGEEQEAPGAPATTVMLAGGGWTLLGVGVRRHVS